MALEQQRALDEILIRVNSSTNNGADGIALRYRSFIADSDTGKEVKGTSNPEMPVAADWDSDEVTSRIGELAGNLQAQVDDLTEQVDSLTAERDTLTQQVASLQDQLDAANAAINATE